MEDSVGRKAGMMTVSQIPAFEANMNVGTDIRFSRLLSRSSRLL